MLAVSKQLDVWFSARTTLTCTTSIDGNQQSPSIFSFVRKLRKECCPSGVVNGPRQHASRKTLHIQFFDSNQTVIIDDFARQFVVKSLRWLKTLR